jgi:hypothetical protein
MEPPAMTEDERNELTVLALLEILKRFGDPVKPPRKLISWPDKKRPQPKPGPSLRS